MTNGGLLPPGGCWRNSKWHLYWGRNDREDAIFLPFPFLSCVSMGVKSGCRESDPTLVSLWPWLGSKVPFSRDTCDDLGLFENNLLGDASFSLIQFLPNAGNYSKSLCQGVGHFLPNQLI